MGPKLPNRYSTHNPKVSNGVCSASLLSPNLDHIETKKLYCWLGYDTLCCTQKKRTEAILGPSTRVIDWIVLVQVLLQKCYSDPQQNLNQEIESQPIKIFSIFGGRCNLT